MSKKDSEEKIGQSAGDAKTGTTADDGSADAENSVGKARDDTGAGASVEAGMSKSGSPDSAANEMHQDDSGNDRSTARQRSRGGPMAAFALLVALVAAGFSAWQVFESRRVTAELELELARKLTEIETIGSDSRRLSTDARDVARDVEARVGQLDARLVDVQNQRLAMDSLYNELSLSRDDWTLTEVVSNCSWRAM